ncbi:hypothetical protein LJB95_00615 [Paludibacteraceae bacterium OttesenSCG-928-F17]|nr:hypothetical protein [Paludibacteraceae bacterium OttesenSCG-928-F17]
MLKQLLSLYQLIDDKKNEFEKRGLSGNFFIDVYRSQPYEPELYEYFSLPAIFVDYSMVGQGKKQSRLITLTLHIVTDELPDASNISEQRDDGLKRFLYNLTLQKILEGSRLGDTSQLIFMTENIIDESVVNYHTQSYEFEASLDGMIDDTEHILGEFSKLNIYGSLTLKNG